jgi:hypothetical protein
MMAATAMAVAAILAFGGAAQGASLLLDLDSAWGTTSTDSPAHAAGAVPAAENKWNKLSADSSSLKWGDGTTATGVGFDLGRSTSNGGTIDWNNHNNYQNFNVQTGGNEFNTLLHRSAVRLQNSAGEIGARVTGLPAGLYDVYVVTVTHVTPNDVSDVSIGADLTQLTSPVTTGPINPDGTWATPADYVVGQVSLSAGQALTVISDHVGGNYASLNSIAIVPVPEAPIPEPVSVLAVTMGMGALGGYLRRRRRRSHSSRRNGEANFCGRSKTMVRGLIAGLAVLGVLVFATGAQAGNVTWQGDDVGDPTAWDVGENWDSGGLPGSGASGEDGDDEKAVINSGMSNYPVVDSDVHANEFHSISLAEGATLTITTNAYLRSRGNKAEHLNGTINMDDGEWVVGKPWIGGSGVMNLSGGTIYVKGSDIHTGDDPDDDADGINQTGGTVRDISGKDGGSGTFHVYMGTSNSGGANSYYRISGASSLIEVNDLLVGKKIAAEFSVTGDQATIQCEELFVDNGSELKFTFGSGISEIEASETVTITSGDITVDLNGYDFATGPGYVTLIEGGSGASTGAFTNVDVGAATLVYEWSTGDANADGDAKDLVLVPESAAPIPEPATMLAMMAGIAALGGYLRRRRGTRTLVALIAAGVLAFAGTAAADTFVTFNDDGSGHNWNTADNWDLDRLPDTGEVAVIPDGFTVDVLSDTAELQALRIGGTLNVQAVLTHKWLSGGPTLDPTGLILVDYASGGEWQNRHTKNEIKFDSDGTNYGTVKLILASGSTPNTPIPHKKLMDLDEADLIVDISNLTVIPTATDPIVLFNSEDIHDDLAFHDVQITGSTDYIVKYDYDNDDILLSAPVAIPEPVSALAVMLGAAALGRYVRRRRA